VTSVRPPGDEVASAERKDAGLPPGEEINNLKKEFYKICVAWPGKHFLTAFTNFAAKFMILLELPCKII
jgi:hypothetical protein